jgi:hypothetical protein
VKEYDTAGHVPESSHAWTGPRIEELCDDIGSVSLHRARAPRSELRTDGTRRHEMTRYLISFDDGAMDFIREQEMPAVAEAAHAVIREAQDAGVWVFAGGLYPHDEVSVSVVGTDGTVTDGAEDKAYIAGVTIIDVPSRAEALEWAAKIAVACRCGQEVREFGADPAVGN